MEFRIVIHLLQCTCRPSPRLGIFLFGYKFRPERTNHVTPTIQRAFGFFTGLQSYASTLEGAKKLLAKSLPIDAQVDIYVAAMTSTLQTSPLVSYCTTESLTCQNRSVWQSNIQRVSASKAMSPRSPMLLLLIFCILGLVFLLLGRKTKACPPCVRNFP